MVLGGPATAGSDDARRAQWAMAWPHILSNPLTGHGFDMGATVVGYGSFITNGTSLDSYPVSLLVETGVPGLIFFVLPIAGALWFGAREYLTDPSPRGSIAGGIACAIFAFGVYRLVLSQHENHTLYFLFLGSMIVLAKLKRDQMQAARANAAGADLLNPTGVAPLATRRGSAPAGRKVTNPRSSHSRS